MIRLVTIIASPSILWSEMFKTYVRMVDAIRQNPPNAASAAPDVR